MQIVIPMSGRGARFADVGYKSIKPLIEVDGAPFIEHVIRLFPGETDFIFICSEDHLRTTPIAEVLLTLVPTARIRAIDYKNLPPHLPKDALGPVPAVLAAADLIEDGRPTIVNYCDFNVHWDYANFKRWLDESKPDGAMTCYRGFHPHSLGPNRYAYLRMNGEQVAEVREKQAFTDDHMSEWASAGTYYFKSGADVKTYFRRAVDQGMKTGKEYYASLPYNLMIADGKRVEVYALDHFLQWGTPEDLEEYQGWSRWFSDFFSWRPSRKAAGTLLVPMLGEGKRFQNAGYTVPKPMIDIGGQTMLARVLHTLPRHEKSIVVTRSSQKSAVPPDTDVVVSEKATRGQVETCLLAEKRIAPESPLTVSACDNVFQFDEEALLRLQKDPSVDFICWAFKNHPHANRNPGQYGCVKTDGRDGIRDISCKQAISGTPRNDFGVTGTFWFRHAGRFFEEAGRMIRDGATVNGEFYVDVLAGNLAKRGLKGKVFLVEHFICLGTPDDVKTFEYWSRYFKLRATVRTERKRRVG